jgi:3-methyl-2-oxobutanoate hydroxymethyltransferase
MGHLGLTPQSILRIGRYRVQGRGQAAKQGLLHDALSLQEAGSFAVVLEAVPGEVAGEITAKLRIPTIGIGAGASCDGQVLVLHDMLGLYEDFKPRFVRHFGHLARAVEESVTSYSRAVRDGSFPADDESYPGG